MCSGSKKSKLTPSPSTIENSRIDKNMNTLTVFTEDSFSSILEHASNNDVDSLKQLVEGNVASVNEVGLWYGRQIVSKQIVLEHRTPLMVAATYGSIDVLKFLLSHPETDINFCCGMDKSTALHCAASGGSAVVGDIVKLLLAAGADTSCLDANGNRPVDVIVVPPKCPSMRGTLEDLLANGAPNGSVIDRFLTLSITSSRPESPALSSSPEAGLPSSPSESSSPPAVSKLIDVPPGSTTEKKEYPIDPSLPDIKNSIYATDEFRMFSFKVRPCSRAYSHDWTECPFVHPGENARRRDPRKFHYSCVPCPEFRKGTCRRGDMCEYAHGVFECWLHPAQYRTRLCKDGTSCNRRVCFFAHTTEELRPLYVSTGSGVPSPRSSASAPTVMDMTAAMSLFPGSPSSVSAMSPSPFAQPSSPSVNGISHSSGPWPQPNVPALHLPGSNFQSSRLRSSLSARDIPPEDLNMFPDFDGQQHLLNDLSCLLQPHNYGLSAGRSGWSKTLTPSNLEELFSTEVSSSPRYSESAMACAFSPTHKSAILNQFQQLQSRLSPINTNNMSPKNVEHPLFQASFGVSSPGRMSPRSMDSVSPLGSRLSAALSQRDTFQQQQLRSLSSRDLGSKNPACVVGSPVNSWSKWGSPNGKVDWSVNGDELHNLRRSSSLEHGTDEPDLSWVQSLVIECPTEMIRENMVVPSSGATCTH